MAWFNSIDIFLPPPSMHMQWLPLPLFLIYRILMFLYIFAWLLVRAVLSAPTDGARYLIYFSDVSYILLCLNFMLLMVGTLVYSMQQCCCKWCTKVQPSYAMRPAEFYRQDNTPWFLKLAWLVNTIAVPTTGVATVVYWSMLYRPGDVVDASSVHIHGMGIFLVLVDVLISRVPVMLFHIIYPTAYGAAYVIFMGIYYWAEGTNPIDGGRYIYQLIDYGRQPWIATGLSIAMVVGMSVSFLVVFGITLLRDQIVKQCRLCFWNVGHPDDDTNSSEYYLPSATTV